MKRIPAQIGVGVAQIGALVFMSTIASPLSGQAEPGDTPECRVFGRVLDAAFAEPVPGAMVWLEAAEGGAFLGGRETSPDGSFSIELDDCGPALLTVSMIGFVDASESMEFESGARMRAVTIRLERSPIELEELTVELERSARLSGVGFYARRAWVEAQGEDLGQFYDPDEVESRAQASHTLGALLKMSRMQFVYEAGPCRPSYYFDGRWFRGSDSALVRRLEYGFMPKDIEGIEIYRSIHGSVPTDYRDPNSTSCGAVVIWTKETPPAEAPQIAVELCEPRDTPLGISFGGLVTDELTGVHLPTSYVTLAFSETAGETRIETISDADGRYRFCDLEAWPSTVEARYGPTINEPFPIDPTRAQAGYFEVDLMLPVVRPGSLVGVVSSDGGPGDAEVRIENTDLSSTTDDRGYFEIHDVAPGDYEVIVRRGAEELLRRQVSIRSGATEAVTLEVGSA